MFSIYMALYEYLVYCKKYKFCVLFSHTSGVAVDHVVFFLQPKLRILIGWWMWLLIFESLTKHEKVGGGSTKSLGFHSGIYWNIYELEIHHQFYLLCALGKLPSFWISFFTY